MNQHKTDPSKRSHRRLRSPPPPPRSGVAKGADADADSIARVQPGSVRPATVNRPSTQKDAGSSGNVAGQGNSHIPLLVDIPVLQSVGAAIFLPIQPNFLTQPRHSTPHTPYGRNRAIQARYDVHASRVRVQIPALVRRECIRIARQAQLDQRRLDAAAAAADSISDSRTLGLTTHANFATMIANMEAPAPDGPPRPPEILPLPEVSKVPPTATPREGALKELVSTCSRALAEINDYDGYVLRTRSIWEPTPEMMLY